MESHSRSIVKAVTGEATLSIGIGLLDSLVKVGAFYLHERMWNRLRFGKLEPPEYQI